MPERRTTDATWFRVLDRFGLPTLFAVLLLGYVLRQGEGEQRERRELLGALRGAIEQQTAALVTLAAEQRTTADAIRATWPRVRLPSPRVATAAPGQEVTP